MGNNFNFLYINSKIIFSEELQNKLALPTAILSCNSIQALQAIALMGQGIFLIF